MTDIARSVRRRGLLLSALVAAVAGPVACTDLPTSECAAGCPSCTTCYFGTCMPVDACGTEDAEGGTDADARLDARDDAAAPDEAPGDADSAADPGVDARPDGGPDGELFHDVRMDLVEDVRPEATACRGARVGGYCWYASEPNGSCSAACAAHGGCNLAGTRDFAGSGGTDPGCIAVLAELGYGGYPHFDSSNNDLGCQFGWGVYTYWSTLYPTTCEAASYGESATVRMCACEM
jgi:hypothetical protein